MLPAQYILCRPMGGLNDVFSQIEKCCRYAELTGRSMVVDTAYPGIDYGVAFSEIFISRQQKLHLDFKGLPADLTQASIYPPALQNHLHDYVIKRTPPAPYVEAHSGQAIEIDFQKRYEHDILVHHQLGSWFNSHFLFLRLGLKPEVTQLFLKRLAQIGGPYVGVHIRHTDYQSDYGDLLERFKKKPPRRLFLATDNHSVLQTFRTELGTSEIFSFAQDLSLNGEPVHMASSGGLYPLRRNQDALVDLLLLALAQSIQVAPLTGRTGWSSFPRYSGFSTLAIRLNRNRILLDHFLKPLQTRGGLGWRPLNAN
jgi:hypothetical protein